MELNVFFFFFCDLTYIKNIKNDMMKDYDHIKTIVRDYESNVLFI